MRPATTKKLRKIAEGRRGDETNELLLSIDDVAQHGEDAKLLATTSRIAVRFLAEKLRQDQLDRPMVGGLVIVEKIIGVGIAVLGKHDRFSEVMRKVRRDAV